MWLAIFLCIILSGSAECSLKQMKKMMPELERSTILGACRTMCLDEYVADVTRHATYYWDCQNITECRKCWDSCQIFSIGGPTDIEVCTGSCKEVEYFYRQKSVYPVKMLPNLPRLNMLQKEEFVELDVHGFEPMNEVSKQTFIYSLFMVKPEYPEDCFFIDQYTWPNVGLPYYNQSVTLYFVVSSKFNIVAYGTLEFIPSPPQPEEVTEATTTAATHSDLAEEVLRSLAGKKELLQQLLAEEKEGEDGVEPLMPSYPMDSLDDDYDTQMKGRQTRDDQDGSLKGFHWNLKADEIRRTSEGLVEVQLKWNPFPASGTYLVTVSSFSKRTTFKALDRAAIFTVVPGEIYNVQVEFTSKKNGLVSMTSPILVVDTIRNTVSESNPVKKEQLQDYAVLGVCVTSVVLVVIIYLIVIMFLKFYRKSTVAEPTTKPKQSLASNEVKSEQTPCTKEEQEASCEKQKPEPPCEMQDQSRGVTPSSM